MKPGKNKHLPDNWYCEINSRGEGGNLHMSRNRDVPLFWVHFGGCSRIFGYLFGLFPDFWVSFFWLFPDFLGIIFGKI